MAALFPTARVRHALAVTAAMGLALGALVALNVPTLTADASPTAAAPSNTDALSNRDASNAPLSSAIARAVSGPTPDANGYAWVSWYRGLAGLRPVTRSADFESGIAIHLRYLADHALGCETDVHDELDTAMAGCGPNPFATAAGKAAANNSDITRVSGRVTDRVAVSNWFGAAFHALVLLDPRLATTGYAAYYNPVPRGAQPLAWPYTAGVDVYRGRTGAYNGEKVIFPASGAVSPLLSYAVGTESPEPFRTSTGPCRSWGARAAVSAPIIAQWPLTAAGAGAAGTIWDVSRGIELPTCTLTGDSYPRGSLGRQFLAGANGITTAAFYFAATPFIAGHRYQLRIAGQVVTDFTTAAQPAA